MCIAELDLQLTFCQERESLHRGSGGWLTVVTTSVSLLTLTVAMGVGAAYVLHLDGGSGVMVAPCDSLGRRIFCNVSMVAMSSTR
jgi:hypothetical protein